MPKPILVVDDAHQTLAELARALAEAGYAPALLGVGTIAVEHFAAQRPDLVFVSLGLPEPLTVCEGIRSDPDGAIVPIVLVGRDHPDVRSPADALNQGADFYFELPLDKAKMLAKVQTYIGRGDKTPQAVTVIEEPTTPAAATVEAGALADTAETPSPLTRSADVLLAAIEAQEAQLRAQGVDGDAAEAARREVERRQAHQAVRLIADDKARREAEQQAQGRGDSEPRPAAEAPDTAEMARRDAEALRQAEEDERRDAEEIARRDAEALRQAEDDERREAEAMAQREAPDQERAAQADASREPEAPDQAPTAQALAERDAEALREAQEDELQSHATLAEPKGPAIAREDLEASRRAEDAAWRRTERELREHDDESRHRSGDELRHRIEEESRQKIEEEVRRRVEEETRKRVEDETRKRLEGETRKRIEDEARKRIEDETRKKVEEEVRRRAEEEARQRVEDETRRRIEEETRARLEEEARRRHADAAREVELRRHVEEEMRREMGLPPLEPAAAPAPPVAAPPPPPAPAAPDALPRPPPRPLAAGMVAPAQPEGTFDRVQDVAAVLAMLSQQQVVGRIDFTCEGRQKAVFFERGLPVDAYSTQTFDRIEEYLLRENRITRAQYQEVRVKGLRGPRRVAAFLASEGYLKPEELFGAVRGHLQETLFGLFELEEGSWLYVPERSAEQDRVALDINLRALVLEGIRRKYTLPRMMAKVGGPS